MMITCIYFSAILIGGDNLKINLREETKIVQENTKQQDQVVGDDPRNIRAKQRRQIDLRIRGGDLRVI